jgi:hypothetical protein
MSSDSSEDTDESLGPIVNPKEDGITVDLEFYDEMLEGVEGVSMPDPPEEVQN